MLETVAAFDPAYMTVPLAEDEGPSRPARPGGAAPDRKPRAAAADCVAYGPGVGQSEELDRLTAHLYCTLPCPLVVDADGLNALARRPQPLAGPGGPRLLTPHPGEFRRLAQDESLPPDRQPSEAERLAREHGVVMVLKGARSLVTDGQTSFRNETGNPGMAGGGSGDVLTGVVTALICQGLTLLDAARLGVHVHGVAGDLAAVELGQVGMTAGDLVRRLPQAFMQAAGGI